MEKRCVFSGDTNPSVLNTSMNIKLDDGQVVEVWVSDAHADSATPKLVKEAYLKTRDSNKKEIDELMARAAALGLHLMAPGATAPGVAAPAPAPVQSNPASRVVSESMAPATPGNRIIDGRAADARSIAPRVEGVASGLGASVSGAGHEYSIASKDKPSTDLKAGEKAEIGFIKGRLGADVAVPVRRVGKTGETLVAVVDTGGDPELQRRFKMLKEQGNNPNGPHDFIRGGYQVRTISCGLCRGSGKVMGGKKVCPKCGGCGTVDVMQ